MMKKKTVRLISCIIAGILVAAILGLLVICFQNPLGRLALWAMNGNEIVHDYFYAASGRYPPVSCSSDSTAGTQACRMP